MTAYVAIALVIVVYSALALRLDRWSISMPMAMTAAGFLLGAAGLGAINIRITPELGKFLVELSISQEKIIMLLSEAGIGFTYIKYQVDNINK